MESSVMIRMQRNAMTMAADAIITVALIALEIG
jgi:hypothetical protein